jgi:hypothetical protein
MVNKGSRIKHIPDKLEYGSVRFWKVLFDNTRV